MSACCSVLQCDACHVAPQFLQVCSALQRVAACCSVLQCCAVCCSVATCVAASWLLSCGPSISRGI